ncbi:isochorismatase family cysteine hydrolase [Streptomyces noursei]|uniref:isochorismatase family cysteine hydrolase n=1 Tax=Streptomyces noursei TaxID=1971 RepID=UPI00380300D2
MNYRQTPLVVVDVQVGFINKHTKAVVPAVDRLARGWLKLRQPVVFTKFFNPPGSPYERITGWTRLRTPQEQRIVEALQPHVQAAAAVIEKPQSNALTAEFTELIKESCWTELVIAGIDTDACVYDTAISAYHAGIRPWIVIDACASTGGSEYHDLALKLAGRNISPRQLITVEAALSGSSGPLAGADIDLLAARSTADENRV